MSLTLNGPDTRPEVRVSMPMGGNATVCFGSHEVSLEDFLAAAHYVLTNTDLEPNDPRIGFVESVRSMVKAPGWNPGADRLKPSVSFVR